jgi:outer membrane protein W
MNLIRSLLFVIVSSFVFVTPSLAGDWYHVQIGVSADSVSSSSSPVTGANVDSKGQPGVDVRVIGEVPNVKNVEWTAGVAYAKKDLSLAGTSLGGGPDTTTILGTVRYRFDADPHFKPYIGAGLHSTSMSGASFNGLNSGSATISGGLLELGARMPFKDSNLYVDLNLSKKYGQTNIPITTTIGAVPVTNVTVDGATAFAMSLGWSFE